MNKRYMKGTRSNRVTGCHDDKNLESNKVVVFLRGIDRRILNDQCQLW